MPDDEWTAKSWNTCLIAKCRGPVEGDGGSVDFFCGSEAHCTSCGALYQVCIAADGGVPWLSRARALRALKEPPHAR